MTIYLLGFNNSRIYNDTTSRQLALEGNFLFRNRLNSNESYNRNDTLIRYGNFTYSSYDRYFGTVFNNAVSVFQNVDKLETHLKLYKNGIRVPKIFFSKDQIKDKDYPIIRRNRHHSRASDIAIIYEEDNMVEGDFYTQLIDSNEEYRLLIMFNECVRLSKKKETEEVIDNRIRSSSTGWTLVDEFKINVEAIKQAIPMCIKALSILDLDFGACDVVIEKDTNIPYLLEVNTSPRLNEYGRQVFIKEIYDHLDLPYPRELRKVIPFEWYDIVPIKYRKSRRYKPTKETYGLENY